MEHEVIFSSEYILITKRLNSFFIESFKSGMMIEQFNKIVNEHPEIKITNFMAIKNALLFAPSKPEKFGEAKDRVTVEVSTDEMRAFVSLCVPETELDDKNSERIVNEIIKVLNDNGVVFGINADIIKSELANNRQILAAQGISPTSGEDSVIRMYELKEARPEIKEDGNADHYELNLINRVKSGEWLGERIDPTKGTPGKSVLGNEIPPLPGKLLPLSYDKKSVREEHKDGITTLCSINDGAVSYDGDKITVSNHLEIEENVDFKTGNINFNGFLTVKGSIEDNFTVDAAEDIEILGDYGVGSVKEIVSRKGSIYIKGGVAGKNKALIKSKKDIYTKYVSDATIICEGRVHIGFYCLNSNIIAKEVVLDSMKGQIIGGKIQAEVKVVSSIIGSPSEKRTVISVKGFNRQELKEKLDKVMADSEVLKGNLNKVKHELSVLAESSKHERYEQMKELYARLRNDMKSLDDEKKNLAGYLRTHGEGEVAILKKAYPGTVLEMRSNVKELNSAIIGTTFYIQNREIKSI